MSAAGLPCRSRSMLDILGVEEPYTPEEERVVGHAVGRKGSSRRTRAHFLLVEKLRTPPLIGARTDHLCGRSLDGTAAAHRGVARFNTRDLVDAV